jgi:hypothetical protein
MHRGFFAAFWFGIVLTGLLLAGCGAERNQNADKKPERDIGPALIINEPKGFRNVAFKCFGPNGVYVTSRGDALSAGNQGSELPSSVYVVAGDENCKKPGAPTDQPTGVPTR